MREKRDFAWGLICGVEGVCLFFFFGICEQLDVFDICVTGHHCSSRLAQKLRCPDHLSLCVCVCMGLCLHIRAAKHCHWRKKKNTQIHCPFFKYPSLLSWDTFWHQQWVCVKLSFYLGLFLLRIYFVSFSPFSSALFFPSFCLSQAFKSRLSMNSTCYFV